MRKFISIIFIFVLTTIAYNESSAQVDFGILFGLSTPNDMINDVYNRSSIDISNKGASAIIREATMSGYHVGVKGRLTLIDDFIFVGGLTYNKFPETEFNFSDPEAPQDIDASTFAASQSIVAFSAGINYCFFDMFIKSYFTGGLQYNYIANNLDYQEGLELVLPTYKPSDSRVGADLGLGFDVPLALVTLSLEGKYVFANLIGKTENELSKNFFMLSFGAYF